MRPWTLLLLIGLALILAYEIRAHVDNEYPSISEYVWRATQFTAMTPLLVGIVFGVLIGHLFWQSQRACEIREQTRLERR